MNSKTIVNYQTRFNFVGADGNRGLWNFFWFPTALGNRGAEKLAHTKFIVFIHESNSLESLNIKNA